MITRYPPSSARVGIPDLTLTGGNFLGGVMCPAESGGYGCTRRKGHTGRHAAGTTREVVAVWS